MKAHFFDWEEPISIIGFKATFELVCDTNRIPKKSAMRTSLHHVHDTIADALSSYIAPKS